MEVRDIAKVCHEANRTYCTTIGEGLPRSWESIPIQDKEGIIKAVEIVKLKPDIAPKEGHAIWLAHKHRNGWVYGKYHDRQKKTDPRIKPYEELPETQKKKNALFIAIVNALV